MINMSQVNLIKELSRVGYPISEIARTMKADEKTVRKYISLENYSPKPPNMTEKPSILDPYKATIDTWLEEDKQSWYKQRHTAQRVHDRLTQKYPDIPARTKPFNAMFARLGSQIGNSARTRN